MGKKTNDNDEEVLVKHKQSGHKRDSPQSPAVGQTEPIISVNQDIECEKCDDILKDTETLKKHMQMHEEKRNNYCEICQDDLFEKYDFILRNKNVHSNQWNC